MRFIFETEIPFNLPLVKADNQEIVLTSVPSELAGIVFPYNSPQGVNTDGMSLESNARLVGYQIQFYGARGLRQGSAVMSGRNLAFVAMGRDYTGGFGELVTLPWIDESFHETDVLFEVPKTGTLNRRPEVTFQALLVDTRMIEDEYLGAPCSIIVQLTVESAFGAE